MFRHFVDMVIEHEGGARFVNHPSDPGGATRWGISLSFARYQKARFDVDGDGDVDAADIRELTRERAVEAYRDLFWLPVRGPQLPTILAFPVFDMAVNQGQRAAVRTLQRTVGAKADGMIGPRTLATAESAVAVAPVDMLEEFTARRAKKYAETRNFASFGKGWMRRAIGVHGQALEVWADER